jgi:hypothetical protein
MDRRRRADVPVVFATMCLLIVLNQLAGEPAESAWGLARVAAGLPAYYVWRARRPKEPRGDDARHFDFHNHYYPPKHIDALRSGNSRVKVTIDANANPVIHYPGDYNVAVRGHRDLMYRANVLDEQASTCRSSRSRRRGPMWSRPRERWSSPRS